jgi:hypothetical protein
MNNRIYKLSYMKTAIQAYIDKLKVKEDEFENYKIKTEIMMGHGFHGVLLSQEEFINKIKTDDEFAKTWKLK